MLKADKEFNRDEVFPSPEGNVTSEIKFLSAEPIYCLQSLYNNV